MARMQKSERSCSPNTLIKILWVVATGFGSGVAQANLAELAGVFSNDLEASAAFANYETYLALVDSGSGGTGACSDSQRVETIGICDGTNFSVFENVRELAHTANELVGSGPTQFSLGSDLEGLGFALRWTAGEEFAAQGSLTSNFGNSQLSGLASRLTALRFGASGFTSAGMGYSDEAIASYGRSELLGGGASADLIDGYSRWGGFLNGAYGFGDKQATVFEDGFDFDGYQVNAGVDYRLNSNWVLGAVMGYTEQEIDFDSSQSIVDGGIQTDGFSVMPFVLYQSEHFFGSLSVGYQQMTLDTDRAIRYPSFNPNVGNADTRSLSSTNSDTISVLANIGYSFRASAFSAEPYLEIEYLGISIDGFTERDINDDGFDFTVGDQSIESREASVGLNLQYTLSSEFGVFIPYVDAQWRNQLEDDSRNVSAAYAGSSSAADFNLATDRLDDQYYVITVGLSSILRGGRQKQAGGPVGGGVQVFGNYKFIEDLDNFSQEVISGGIRYEF